MLILLDSPIIRCFVGIVTQSEKPFFFEVQVQDEKGIRRRFRASNFQSTTRMKPFVCGMPLRMTSGWNHIHLDLAALTNKAFGACVRHCVRVAVQLGCGVPCVVIAGTKFVSVTRVVVHSTCRIQRIFFSDKLYTDPKEWPRGYALSPPSE